MMFTCPSCDGWNTYPRVDAYNRVRCEFCDDAVPWKQVLDEQMLQAQAEASLKMTVRTR